MPLKIWKDIQKQRDSIFKEGRDAMVERNEALRNLNSNIDYIKKHNELANDAEFCRVTGVSKATLSSVRKGERIPMIYPFFEQVCAYSSLTVDTLLNRLLEEESEEEDERMQYEQDLQKCVGVYGVYYNNTSSLKGRESKSDAEALKYAVLLIYRENGEYGCLADFGLSKEEQAERYKYCFKTNSQGKILRKPNFKTDFVNKYMYDKLYFGTIRLNDRSIVIELEASQDIVTMMLRKYAGTSSVYHGGLAAAVSYSKGVESVPVLQVIGISRALISDSAEVISSKLYLTYPSIKCIEEDEKELLEMIQKITDGNAFPEAESGVPAFGGRKDQMRLYLHEAMTRAINRTVQRNLCRCFRISHLDNNDWYHYAISFEEG